MHYYDEENPNCPTNDELLEDDLFLFEDEISDNTDVVPLSSLRLKVGDEVTLLDTLGSYQVTQVWNQELMFNTTRERGIVTDYFDSIATVNGKTVVDI